MKITSLFGGNDIKKLLLKDYSDFFKISKENVKEKKMSQTFSLKYISKSVVVFEVFVFLNFDHNCFSCSWGNYGKFVRSFSRI